MEKIFDVVIAGAGPAGTTTAILLGKKRTKTLLIEKQKMPREKVCADCISPRAMQMLRELGLEKKLEKISNKVFGANFFSPNNKRISCLGFGKTKKLLVCERKKTDFLLFQEAKKFAETRIATVTGFSHNADKTINVLFRQNGRNKKAKAKVLVAADGWDSAIARQLGMQEIDPRHSTLSIRAYLKGKGIERDKINFFFFEDIMPGYFWIFPLKDKLNIGFGMVEQEIQKTKTDLEKKFSEKLQSKELSSFLQKPNMKKARIERLPFATKPRKPAWDNILLVGDAAFLADPRNGGGIGNAMLSAKLAAQTIEHALQKKDYTKKALKEYQKSLEQTIFKETKTNALIQMLGKNKGLLNFVVSKAQKDSELAKMIVGLVLDDNAGRFLFKKEFWKRLLF